MANRARESSSSLPAGVDPELFKRYEELAQRERLLPVRVPAHYRFLIEEEVRTLGNTSGPLYKIVYPTESRFSVRARGEVDDFVQDNRNMPPQYEDILVQKYSDRVLFLATEKCAGHCMYCFRQDVLVAEQGKSLPTFDEKLQALITYVGQRSEIHEVIFSGGDPLMIPIRSLSKALTRLRSETCIRHVRLHTRNIVFAPSIFTKSLCELLSAHEARLVFHIVHPYEITSKVRAGIGQAVKAGVRCYAQFPLLRGVNDHILVLRRLLGELDDLRVRTLSLFIPDPVNYSATFRLPLKRIFGMIDYLNHTSPSWINAIRLVLDTPIGKVRREDIVHWDETSGIVTFARSGQEIEYHDLPQDLDVVGDPKILLWMG